VPFALSAKARFIRLKQQAACRFNSVVLSIASPPVVHIHSKALVTENIVSIPVAQLRVHFSK
jgi:hypothetical protein